jgi:hypothetical protein
MNTPSLPPKDKQMNIPCSQEFYEQVRQAAQQQDMTISAFVRRSINIMLKSTPDCPHGEIDDDQRVFIKYRSRFCPLCGDVLHKEPLSSLGSITLTPHT